MLVLAEQAQQVDPSFLGQWVLAAGVMLTLLLQIRQYQDRNKKQQREIVGDSLTVKAAITHATADDLKRLEHAFSSLTDRLDNIHRHMDTSREKILEAGEERMTRIASSIQTLESNLHNRVTDVANRVSNLEGRFEVILAGTKNKSH